MNNERPLRLTPNRRKILEALLYLINTAHSKNTSVTQYELVKSLFLADTSHLNAYGRPVIFDNYSALKFGPVPEEAYDMLKPEYDAKRFFDEPWPPWHREPATRNAFTYVPAGRQPNMRALSTTDKAALDEAFDLVKRLTFFGVVDYTHEHPAYKAAWDARGTRRAARMDYAYLFNEPDQEAAHEVAQASKYA